MLTNRMLASRMSRLVVVAAFSLAGVGLLTSAIAEEGEFPYDEMANAEADVAAAVAIARDSKRFLLINFGANWCPDCRALARVLDAEPFVSLLDAHFVSVRVDIGNWDKHQTLSKQYGDPAAQGIPAIAIVDQAGNVRYATQAGELATARNMGADQLQVFFENLIVDLEES